MRWCDFCFPWDAAVTSDLLEVRVGETATLTGSGWKCLPGGFSEGMRFPDTGGKKLPALFG